MKVIVCDKEGDLSRHQPPAASEVHIVSKGELVQTFMRQQGDSAVVINLDQVQWVMVDMND